MTRCTSYIQRFPALARLQPRKPATRISINVRILLRCHQTLIKKPKLPAKRLTAIKIHQTKSQILLGMVRPKISERKISQDKIHTPLLLFAINSVLVKLEENYRYVVRSVTKYTNQPNVNRSTNQVDVEWLEHKYWHVPLFSNEVARFNFTVGKF